MRRKWNTETNVFVVSSILSHSHLPTPLSWLWCHNVDVNASDGASYTLFFFFFFTFYYFVIIFMTLHLKLVYKQFFNQIIDNKYTINLYLSYYLCLWCNAVLKKCILQFEPQCIWNYIFIFYLIYLYIAWVYPDQCVIKIYNCWKGKWYSCFRCGRFHSNKVPVHVCVVINLYWYIKLKVKSVKLCLHCLL